MNIFFDFIINFKLLYHTVIFWGIGNILSLTGLRIAITSSRRASELAYIVKNFGGISHIAPTIAIEAKQGISKEIENFIIRMIGKNSFCIVHPDYFVYKK